MKYIFIILAFFLFSFNSVISMDPVENQESKWKLYATFAHQKNIHSAYFDKQDRLLICKSGHINQIDMQTKSMISLNNCTNPYDSLAATGLSGISILNFTSEKIFSSACLLRNKQFLAWSTSDEGRKKDITPTKYLVTLENNLAERKVEYFKANDSSFQIIPAFDSQNRPNYLSFGSDCGLTPMHFDGQEELFALSNNKRIGICKIMPNPDCSQEYAARFDCEFPVTFLCFHPIKRIIAAVTQSINSTQGSQSHVSVFDVDAQKQLFSLPFAQAVLAICFNKENYLAAVTKKTVEIIYLNRQKIKKRVKNTDKNVSACFHPQENTLAILSKDIIGKGILRLIDVDNKNDTYTFAHTITHNPLQCFNATGKYLVTLEKNSINLYEKSKTGYDR